MKKDKMGRASSTHMVLVGKPGGKRPLGRPRRRREDNVNVCPRETGWDDMDWINLAEDRDQ
jgi:hypothetical protein